jgi:hypothetical protein
MTIERPDDVGVADAVAPDTKSGGPNACPECGGTGRLGPEDCETCHGTGQLEEAVGGG